MGIPARSVPREYKIAAQALEYVRTRDWIKLTALVRDIPAAETAHFEQTYAHQSGRSLNPHQLRDDIREYWGPQIDLRQVTEKLIAELQKRNPLPPKVSYTDVVKSALAKQWPEAQRQRTRVRLKDPKTWPKGLQHPRLTKDLQLWGNWILDNYEYLRTSNVPPQIGATFSPPARPDDDIQAIAEYKTRINDANMRLMQACEKGPWLGPFPLPGETANVPKTCLEILRVWEKLFAETKGQVSANLLLTIRAKIQQLEARRRRAA